MYLFQGPTSYAPVIEAAIDIVEKSGGQYHVLVIVADGQVESEVPYLCLSHRKYAPTCIIFINVFSFTVKVTRSVDTRPGELSPQERKTIQSIVDAR